MSNISPDHSPKQEICPNCKKELFGQFCFSCGQNQKGYDRFFWSIINESLDNVFSKRSRVLLTLFYLLVKPGFLAVEYFSGRRARYIQPIKLYIVTSLIFFSFLSISNYFSDDVILPQHIVIDGDSNDPDKNVKITLSENISSEITDTEKEQAEIRKVQEELKKSLVKLDIEFLDEDQNKRLKEKLEEKIRGFVDDASGSSKSFASKLIESAPLGLFLLVPIFALMLKIFYLSSGIYYTQHLIFAVYNHSFIFLIMGIKLFLGFFDSMFLSVTQFMTSALDIWIVFYIFMSMKVAYQESISLTITKFLFLGLLYLFWLFVIFVFLFLWNLLVF